MKLVHKYPLLGSSVDSDKFSLTLKALGPFLLLLVTALKLDITPGEVDQVVATVGAFVSGGVFLYGVARKFKR